MFLNNCYKIEVQVLMNLKGQKRMKVQYWAQMLPTKGVFYSSFKTKSFNLPLWFGVVEVFFWFALQVSFTCKH
jgi:hypothetical protein